MWDYSKTIFDKGIVCFNKNNNRYCVVIDGHKGSADDRCSTVLEHSQEGFIIIHTPPNRALVPTGQVYDLSFLKKALEKI